MLDKRDRSELTQRCRVVVRGWERAERVGTSKLSERDLSSAECILGIGLRKIFAGFSLHHESLSELNHLTNAEQY